MSQAVMDDPSFIVSPFVVIRDSREKAPWGFTGIRADADVGHRNILVQKEYAYLPSGDYSIQGATDRIAIERKSIEDLFSTLGQHRDRFERELERLAALEFAMVIVEADWKTILLHPPDRSRLNPKTVLRSVLAWQQRFSNVHWLMMNDRRLAEVACYRVLERFWKDKINGQRNRKPQGGHEQ